MTWLTVMLRMKPVSHRRFDRGLARSSRRFAPRAATRHSSGALVPVGPFVLTPVGAGLPLLRRSSARW